MQMFNIVKFEPTMSEGKGKGKIGLVVRMQLLNAIVTFVNGLILNMQFCVHMGMQSAGMHGMGGDGRKYTEWVRIAWT
jgi:hypothetical protein